MYFLLRMIWAITLMLEPVIATEAVATPVIAGGKEAASVASDFYGSETSQGFDFTPIADVTLTALGVWDFGLNGVSPAYGSVGLWQTSSAALLASANVTNADPLDSSVVVEGGAWRYQALVAPVILTSGTTYTLGFLVASTVTPQESLFLSYPTLVVDPVILILDRARVTSLTANLQFPQLIAGPAGDFMRTMVNAQVVSPIPAPASCFLLVLGLAVAAFLVAPIRMALDGRSRPGPGGRG